MRQEFGSILRDSRAGLLHLSGMGHLVGSPDGIVIDPGSNALLARSGLDRESSLAIIGFYGERV